MTWFRNLSLSLKLNLVIIVAACILAAVVLLLVTFSTASLIDELGQSRIAQEAILIGHQLERVQEELETSITLLVNTPGLVEAVAAHDENAIQALYFSALPALQIENLGITDAEGNYLIDTQQDEGGNELITQALHGIQRATLVVNDDNGRTRVAFAVTRPLRAASGEIVGGLFFSRELSDQFLNLINLERAGVELSLIYENQVIASSSATHDGASVDDGGDAFAIHPLLASEALSGAIAINYEIVYSDGGIPHAEAYLPVQGLQDRAPKAIVVVRVDNNTVSIFQQHLITNSAIVLAILFAGIAGAIILIVRLTITRRLTLLRKSASDIAEGNYEKRVDIQGQDEIGELAHTFNQMTGHLQERQLALQELNQSLEQRVVERTVELTVARDEALAARRIAQESSRVKGEFLANVSHELRTPLNAIIGFSDMLLMGLSGELNPKQTHKITRLRQNGVRLLNLVNDILDITRIEAKRIELQPHPFSPDDLVNRLKNQMQVLADEKGLAFSAVVDPALPATLVGDEKRIEQVIVNLLSNAFKFTEQGCVQLELTADRRAQTWSILVQDTGIGIPPHAQEVIFEEFRQVDGSATRAYKGSGLGLAITRNLVRIMSGYIGVKSEVGKGTIFTATLPLLEGEPQAEQHAAEFEPLGV